MKRTGGVLLLTEEEYIKTPNEHDARHDGGDGDSIVGHLDNPDVHRDAEDGETVTAVR